MREALAARHDRDFVLAAPAPRRRAKTVEEVGLGRRVLSFALSHPLEIAAVLLLAGAGSTIAWNALVMQTSRHPAPLFGTRPKTEVNAPLPPTRPAPATSSAVAPEAAPSPAPAHPVDPGPAAPARPAARDGISDLIRTGEPPASSARPTPALPPARPTAAVNAPASRTVTTPQKPPVMRDGIGDLIRLGEPAPIPPGLVGRTEANRTVSAGQRALSKLGYGVTADGIMGPGTRQAIEQFERDRRLPVTGEFGPQTIRALTAQSGVQVD